MSTKNAPAGVPVDDRDLDQVTDQAWARDDSTDRFRNRLQQDDKAQARFEQALGEIHDHQATLAEVRRAQQLTQSSIGALLEMDQSEVSRLERRSDMLLSTLRSFIQAAGGDLQLIATFPEAAPISLFIGATDPSPQETSQTPNNKGTNKKAAD